MGLLQVDTEESSNTAAISSEDLARDEEMDVVEATITPTGSRPHLTCLSEVSKQYDRNGKGFLDDAERALRNLDSDNLGYLTVDKMYSVMETLQKEQKQSSDLLAVLEQQQRQMISLKKSILLLVGFAVLLAISNIGTSFAAARLAKEVKVSSDTGDLVDLNSGQRVAVTEKIVNFDIQPVSPERRRKLNELSVCNRATGNANRGNGNQEDTCTIAGTLSYNDMVKFHQQFCNGWSPGKQGCTGGGVSQVRLTCNGRISVFTDEGLDEIAPHQDPGYFDWTVFPASKRRYYGTHWVFPPNQDNYPGPPCKQEFVAGMYCNTFDDSQECLVLAMMPAGTEPCFSRFVEICGSYDDYVEGEEGR